MDTLKWWQQTAVYQIYPRSFQDTTGSGEGDIAGVTRHLDYLKKLGVGAIWLTPVYPSPMVDNGYDISDYTAIDGRYGTIEDMDTLIAEGKKRDIRVVMDLVYNHTSDQHAWFQESKRSRTNDKADWYIWRDAKEDGSAPTNWRSIFGGPAWTWCEERQQYYLHTFAVEQPDLNWENPAVRQALYDAANFWIAKGVGGFRIDAIVYIKKPAVFTDGPVDGADGLSSIHKIIANTPGILDFLHEFRRKVFDGHDIFTVAEANGVTPADLPQWVGKDGAFSMLFEFSHVNLEFPDDEVWCRAEKWPLTKLKKALSDSQQATAANGWYPIFFENHDQIRCVNRYFPEGTDKKKAAKAMATILFSLRGTPFIYEGQELGMANTAFAISKTTMTFRRTASISWPWMKALRRQRPCASSRPTAEIMPGRPCSGRRQPRPALRRGRRGCPSMTITSSAVLRAKNTMIIRSSGTTAASRPNASRGKWQPSCSEGATKSCWLMMNAFTLSSVS